MDNEELKDIIFEQEEQFEEQSKCSNRTIKLDRYIATSLVIVISGVRRCGKSTLLYLIKEKMKLKQGEFLYFNFDDERVPQDVMFFSKLYNLFKEIYGKEPVFFFDEVQNIKGWEKFVNRMYEKGRKLFVTGSNARMLSSEIASTLTGRNMTISLFPFSFDEYLTLKKTKYNLNRLTPTVKNKIKSDFDFYFHNGGFPIVDKEGDLKVLHSYFQDIFYRDIIARYAITEVESIKQLALYAMSNIGKLFSYSTLQKISSIKSRSTIKTYLEYYNQSYLLFYLSKFDYSVKKQIMNPKKMYVIDQGFSSQIGFNFSANKGRILENVVFLELKRRGKEIYYHSKKNECDFVVKEGLEIVEAIQVCYDLNFENEKRELAGLIEAVKTYDLETGIILTMDQDKTIEHKGFEIQLTPVWKWLITNSGE